ncbi:MAG: hypothetical protein K0R71_1455 [Bacillales bacterium]|jgi:uncharacterized membrane protein YczE|nr:hypothetical protein [Bacillales bacterium]
MIKEIKKYCVLILLIVCAGIGVAITLKASIGVGAWDAMTKSIALLTDVKIGTMGMILNCTCVLGQLLLLRSEFKLKQFLQIPVSILLGIVVNFILYEVLTGFTLENYIIRLILFVLAIVVVALAVSAVMVLNVVTFAVEGFCMALSKKIHKNFAMLRQGVDILSIVISLILTFVFSQELTLREGTIVGMLLFGPLIGTFMKLLKPIFKNLGLANEN